MRAIIQRVSRGRVSVEGRTLGEIGAGMVILLGAGHGDGQADADRMADKITNLRIFADAEGKTNLSLLDVGGEALVISQFTLYADCRKGRRPSFTGALAPERADELIRGVASHLAAMGLRVAQGSFGAKMAVSLVNDGPVTILLDSSRAF